MSSLLLTSLFAFLLLFFTTSTTTSPVPPLHTHTKRKMTTGARAGMGIGLAVLALLVICTTGFLVFHFRRRRHLAALNRERAILAGEKNPDGTDKVDKFAPAPPPPALQRNKSVKDRLMGPLYRGSTIELPTRPNAAGGGIGADRDSVGTDDLDGLPLVNKPWANASPRPSFSSKRATRMMMLM